MSVELYRECKNCGTKLKQHVSFSEDNGRITIKVYRYKCPFCDALIKKPTTEEIRSAIIRRAEERNGQKKERKHKEIEVILDGEIFCGSKILKTGDVNIRETNQVHRFKNESKSPVKILVITVSPFRQKG